MATKVYISSSIDERNKTKATKVLDFYKAIFLICMKVGLQPYLRRLCADPDAPDSFMGEIVEARLDKLLCADVAILYLGSPSLELVRDLNTITKMDIPIIVLYEKDAQLKGLKQGMTSNIYRIKFNSCNDALAQLEKVLLNISPHAWG